MPARASTLALHLSAFIYQCISSLKIFGKDIDVLQCVVTSVVFRLKSRKCVLDLPKASIQTKFQMWSIQNRRLRRHLRKTFYLPEGSSIKSYVSKATTRTSNCRFPLFATFNPTIRISQCACLAPIYKCNTHAGLQVDKLTNYINDVGPPTSPQAAYSSNPNWCTPNIRTILLQKIKLSFTIYMISKN